MILYVRSFMANVVFYGLLILGVVLSTLFSWIVPHKWTMAMWNDYILPFNTWSLKYLAGIEVEARGVENILKTPAIYASKHQSAFETYFLTVMVRRATLVMKKELTYVPLFGWAFYFYQMIVVDRKGGAKAMKQMLLDAKRMIANNRSIIIFPEGTRTKPKQPGQYKSGITFLYQNLGVPVVPVACNTGYFWEKSSFKRRPGKMIFEFLPAIEPGEYSKEFLSVLEDKIENACAKINAETLKQNPTLIEVEWHEKTL